MFASVSFIGSGRIARIMLGGWKKSGTLPPAILLFDTNPEAISALQDDFPSVRAVSLEEAAQADLVFGALHPPAMPETLADIAGQLKDQAVFCSLAPRVKLAAIKEKLGGFGRVARINPNAPSIVGQGFNPIAFAEDLPDSAREQLMVLLRPLGQPPRSPSRCWKAMRSSAPWVRPILVSSSPRWRTWRNRSDSIKRRPARRCMPC